MTRSIEVLVVEDEPADQLMIRSALENSPLPYQVSTVSDGLAALEHLRRPSEEQHPRPNLILLDLQLPRMPGLELLAELQADEDLSGIPVVVLSGHCDLDLAQAAYDCSAVGVLAKPKDLRHFEALIRALVFGSDGAMAQRPPEDTQGPRVLVLEDEPTDQILIKKALHQAYGGRAEVDVVERVRDLELRLEGDQIYDVVLSDLHLPDAVGLATIERVHRAFPGPVVVLTGSEHHGSFAQAAIAAGMQDFLPKRGVDASLLKRSIEFARTRDRMERGRRDRERMEAIGRVASGIGHDFNNFLTVLRSNAEYLSSELTEPELSEVAQELLTAVDHAAGLVRPLVSYSGRPLPVDDLNDLGTILEEEAPLIRRILHPGMWLQLSVAPQLPKVRFNRGTLSRILLNLAQNAVHAMEGRSGAVTLSARITDEADPRTSLRLAERPGRFVVVSVDDEGRGIEPRDLPRIFDPYFTTKPFGKGTGLGLALVLGMVRQVRGWVGVRSQLHKGTGIDMYLPIAR